VGGRGWEPTGQEIRVGDGPQAVDHDDQAQPDERQEDRRRQRGLDDQAAVDQPDAGREPDEEQRRQRDDQPTGDGPNGGLSEPGHDEREDARNRTGSRQPSGPRSE
jgi:hypothetical protein